MNPTKLAMSRLFQRLGLSRALLDLQTQVLMPFVRAVNYHDVPPSMREGFESHLRYYAERFVRVGPDDLDGLLAGSWPHDRPGILISFDDGLRSHVEVAAPLLEKHGFQGWFMVPAGFVDEPVSTQRDFATDHMILCDRGWQADSRLALSWHETRQLAEGHVVCCHGYSHERLATVPSERLDQEVVHSRARLESEIGRTVDSFCWIGGEEWSYSAEAARAIRDAGYRRSFMTNNRVITPNTDSLQLQRTNVEADYPLDLVAFQISGFLDALYGRRRARVNRLTASP